MSGTLFARALLVFLLSLRRPLVLTGLAMGAAVAILYPRLTHGRLQSEAIRVLVLWSVYALGSLMIHVKDLFAHPRLRLTPGFVGPHLIAGALLALIGAGLLTLGLSVGCGLGVAEGLALLALVALLLNLAAWATLNPPGLALILGVLFAATILPPPYSMPLKFLQVATAPLSVATLVVAAAGLALYGRQLATLHEEHPAYRQWFQFRPPTEQMARDRVTQAATSRISRFQLLLQDRQLDRAIARPGLVWPVRRWSLELGGWIPVVMIASLFVGCFYLGVLLLGCFQPIDLKRIAPMMFNALLAGAIMLTIMRWRQVRDRMGLLLLRPVTRRGLLVQLALAVLYEAVLVGAGVVLVGLTVLSLTGAGLTGRDWTASAILLLGLGPLGAACMFWLLRIRSRIAFGLATGGLVWTMCMGTMLLRDTAHWSVSPGAAAAIAAGIAPLVAWGAWRHWLTAELG